MALSGKCYCFVIRKAAGSWWLVAGGELVPNAVDLLAPAAGFVKVAETLDSVEAGADGDEAELGPVAAQAREEAFAGSGGRDGGRELSGDKRAAEGTLCGDSGGS
jgi:hypothetical protein